MNASPNCIFCKIVAGQIPSRKVYEDDEILAFHDINPWAPVHFLIIPKAHILSMSHVGPEHQGLLGRMLTLAPKLAIEQGANPSRRRISHRDQYRQGGGARGAPPAFPCHGRAPPLVARLKPPFNPEAPERPTAKATCL